MGGWGTLLKRELLISLTTKVGPLKMWTFLIVKTVLKSIQAHRNELLTSEITGEGHFQ